MKKFIVQTALLIIVIFGALIFANPVVNPGNIHLPFIPQQTKVSNLEINGQTVKAEIADTKEKRRQGLGGKVSLAEDEGMLFIFENTDKHPFWMKGLSFPLDFVWIKGETVMDILQNIQPPQPGMPDSELPIYSANTPVDKVLELSAGSVKKLNIQIGNTIKLQ